MENNWTINQTKELFALVRQCYDRGEGLKNAFSEMSERSGRSINSIRNYYYSQLKMFELIPSLATDLGITPVKSGRQQFELFKADEITVLMERILTGKAKGVSVRATIADMAASPKEALRLQNKYRSMVAHHKSKVTEIMNSLAKRDIPYYNPYLKKSFDGGSKNVNKLSEYISRLDENEVGNFLSILGKLI